MKPKNLSKYKIKIIRNSKIYINKILNYKLIDLYYLKFLKNYIKSENILKTA